ncbi:PKD domain-containing protein [Micromonospora sp. NPDC004540]|uniref:PKD domain-containing protein n=1 Tax=Micromonospora sp. NPDC004540 TaxID=3154457 RepID=UPI0033A6ACF1
MTGMRRWWTATLVATVASVVLLPPAAARATEPEPDPATPTITTTATQLGSSMITGLTERPAEELPATPPEASEAQLRDLARKRALASNQDIGFDVAQAVRESQRGASSFGAQSGDEGDVGVLREVMQPPAVPDNDFAEECQTSAAAANDRVGYIKNRMQWCGTYRLTATAIDPKRPGFMSMTFVVVGYGRDDGVRDLHFFLRPMSVVFFGSLTAADSLSFGIDCYHDTTGCSESGDHRRTLGEWLVHAGTKTWSPFVLSSAPDPDQPDKMRFHPFAIEYQFKTLLPNYVRDDATNEPLDYFVRCDSADYFGTRTAACIFHDVLPHLIYPVLNADGSDSPVKEVAQHIQDAFANPNETRPHKLDGYKNIPGNYDAATETNYLQRVPYQGSEWNENSAEKDRACQGEWPYTDTGIPLEDRPTDEQDCDEYPFASTLQGAAARRFRSMPVDFSVRAVLRTQNRSAGAQVPNFYRDDRILYRENDWFWVQIVPRGDAGAADGPIVSVASKVEGSEGQPIQLYATMRTESAETDITWTVAGTDGNDPGATCSFDNPHNLQPKITCSDDGVYHATLTVDDGVHPPVSRSTEVTVHNIPPQVSISRPAPWQVFRVGTPVEVTAPFTDAANDTHTCDVSWDDSTTTRSVPTGRVCTQTHTFTSAGMYTIEVAVTDDDGGTGTANVMVVVYDPEGGFLTDGGVISSPAGAFPAGPEHTGKLIIQASVKYQPGESGPVPGNGRLAADLEGGEMRLQSTGFEWLVVSPTGKVAVKGVGTVGGQAGFGFLLYGDDDPDGLRLVVWRLGDNTIPNNQIIYDNRPSSLDLDESSLTAMATGAIQIHD